jgi:hypothetical protein
MVSVCSSVPWPADEQLLDFGGRAIRLVPPRRDQAGELRAYPLAAIEYVAGDSDEALVRVIRRFLSALSWRDQAGIREVDVTYGAPLRTGTRVPDNGTTTAFDAADLPDPPDNRARMALAFYGEGMALIPVHIAYSFLSFFKVLNLRFAKGPDQVAWITAQYAANALRHCAVRLNEIVKTTSDVGAYLYGSGRCAVAHAFSEPLFDPNEIAHQQRLSRDLPIIRALAAVLIRTEWAVAAPRYNAAA